MSEEIEGTLDAAGSDPQTYEVTVNGETQQVSIEDLQKAYSKVSGADAKFREAHELKSAAEKAMDTQSWIQKAIDEDNLDYLAKAIESVTGNPEAARAYVYGDPTVDEGTGGTTVQDTGSGGSLDVESVVQAISQGNLGKRMEFIENWIRQEQAKVTGQSMGKDIQKALDNHPKVGKILGKLDDAGKQTVQAMAIEIAARRQKMHPNWGPRVTQEVANELEQRLAGLGLTVEQPLPPGRGSVDSSAHLISQEVEPYVKEEGPAGSREDFGKKTTQSLMERIRKSLSSGEDGS